MLGSSTATTSVFAYPRNDQTNNALFAVMDDLSLCVHQYGDWAIPTAEARYFCSRSKYGRPVSMACASLAVSRARRVLRVFYKGANQISAAWVSHSFSPACHQFGRFQRTLSQWPLRLDLPSLSITFGS
jgi:hypothetical protein